MAAATLTVQGAESAYPVIIESGALESALPDLARERGFARAAVITNDTLAPLYGEALVKRLPGAFLLTMPDGEPYKNLDTVRDLYDHLLAAGADRSTLIIGLGGGVVGDTAGFVAASFMRGVPFIQAPTSLLAMVDASIGGKVGVDLPQGKNLVGAFKDPLAVIADIAALDTLPPAEFRSGMAEVIKAGLINDPPLFAHLQKSGPTRLEIIITRAVMVKKQLVEQDRLEGGARALLNLGHTFGHALEHLSGYAYKHGEAVAIGMAAAARLSARRRMIDDQLAQMIEDVTQKIGLPVRFSGYDPAALWDVMSHDKKWRNGQARFILLAGVGAPVIVSDVTRDEAIAALEDVRE